MQPTLTKRQTLQARADRGENIFRTGSQANPGTASAIQATTPRQSTGFTVPLPDTVPAEALNGNIGRIDVRGMRDTMEQNNLATEQFNTDYGNLMGRVQAPLQSTPFQNPQAFIEQTLLRRSTDTQNTLDQTRQGQADTLRGMGNELDTTRQNAVEQFALPELQQNLADTRNKIAERTNLLRTTIRDFETNAERRGVARQFVESEKQKVQADAAAELADLAIIESAQAGNVAMAQEDIDRAVNAKLQSFEFENQAIQTEIKRLEAMDTRESQARSEQLQIALTERTRNIEQAVADEKQKLTYLSEAARNGADQGTLDAIRKATNVGEAAMMAGPFIGRLDRMQAEASIASNWASVRQKEVDTALALFDAGDPSAISKLGYNPADVNGGIEGARNYEVQKADIQMGLGAAQALLNNVQGIKLSTGAYQSPLLSALGNSVGATTAGGAIAGSIVPAVGTVMGAIGGAIGGLVATPFYYSKTKTAKDEALASASFLINDTTFQEIRDLKASGVTFGNMTEGERIAAGRAASELAAAAIIDESGKVTGFRGSEETITRYVQDLQKAYQGRQEYLDAQYAIKPEEQTEAQSIWNSNPALK